jgi:hypothetical protein
MHILVAIVLIAGLALAWDAYGSKTVLKAIGLTVGGSLAALLLIVVIAEIREKDAASASTLSKECANAKDRTEFFDCASR